MKARIAVTLIKANQYSSSPNRPTCEVLIAMSSGGHPDHPHPRRHAGEPEREVDGDRGHFRADRQDLDEGVGGTHDEAGPRREVAIGEDAERSGDRVHHRHLGERVAHHERDHRADDVGDDHAGTGQAGS